MANPRLHQNADWEGNLAAVSLAGVRPILQTTVAVGAGSEATYTLQHAAVKRVVLFYESNTNLDIRVDLNATASASSLPMVTGAYFVMEVDQGDVVHLFNTTGGSVTVYVAEIR